MSVTVAIQEYSVLLVSFHLQRHMGNFLIQVYGPCIREKKNRTNNNRVQKLMSISLSVSCSFMGFILAES